MGPVVPLLRPGGGRRKEGGTLRTGQHWWDTPAVGPSMSNTESRAPRGSREAALDTGDLIPSLLWNTGLGHGHPARCTPGTGQDAPNRSGQQGRGWLSGISLSGHRGRIMSHFPQSMKILVCELLVRCHKLSQNHRSKIINLPVYLPCVVSKHRSPSRHLLNIASAKHEQKSQR